MVHPGSDGFQPDIVPASEEELEYPSDKRIHVLASAMKLGWTVDHIHKLTKIDKWFLHKLKRLGNFWEISYM